MSAIGEASALEKGSEVGRQVLWFGEQLPSHDPYHAIGRRQEASVAAAVLAHGSLRAVGLEVVQLTDEARFGPVAVDLEAVIPYREPMVQAWAWDAMGVEEREKEFLEGAADSTAGIVLQSLEASRHDGRAVVVRMASEERRQRDGSVDPEVFHLPERALGCRLAFVRGEVEDGSGCGRDRDPVMGRHLICGKGTEVAMDRAP
jgi:hypothetical protein